MLVVERRRGSAVLIGDEVRVEVRWIKSRQSVRLGIEAPKHIRVLREELREGDRVELTATSGSGRELKVVTVEDDPGHAQLIEEVLRECEIDHLELIASGDLALARFDEMTAPSERVDPRDDAVLPDLILLDLQLPDMSGLDILTKLRSQERFAGVPIVMLSSVEDQQQINACLKAGATAFVSKAARYDDFHNAVARIVDFWANARRVG